MSSASAWVVGASYMAVDCSEMPNEAFNCSMISSDVSESTPASKSGTLLGTSMPMTSRTMALVLISVSIRSAAKAVGGPLEEMTGLEATHSR